MATQVDLVINTKANVAELEKATASAQEFIDTIKLGVGIDLGGKLVEGIGEAAASFREAISEGIKFNSEVQDATLALAALAKNAQPEKFHSLGDAMATSAKGVEALRKAAVSSPFNFATLLETLTGLSGPLYAAGAKDLQKQVDLVVLLSNAAKTLNIPQQLFQSDARDLIEGRVGKTLLGTGLGIKNEDIQQAQKAGTEVQFLTDKLSAFGEAGTKSLDNFSTRLTNVVDALQQVEGVATEGLFQQVSDLTNDLGAAVKDPDFVSDAKVVGAELNVLFSGVRSLVEIVADNPSFFLAFSQTLLTTGAAIGLLNLPRLITGLIQIATNAVPAIANLATLGKATASEGAAVDTATAKIAAQTAALRDNAAATQATADAQTQAAEQQAGPSATPIEDAAASAATDQTRTDTEATEANTAATNANNAAAAQADEEAVRSNALTEASTALTEENTLATDRNTQSIIASNAGAEENDAATESSNALTVESTALTDDNTLSTIKNTAAIDQSNAAAVANNAETETSNSLTQDSTVVTDQNTASTVRSNLASQVSLDLAAKESAITVEENALTRDGIAADSASLAIVTQGNIAAAASIDLGKQEVKIIKDENAVVLASTAETRENTKSVTDNTAAAIANEAATEELADHQKHVAQAAQQATAAIKGETAAIRENVEAAHEAQAVGATAAVPGAVATPGTAAASSAAKELKDGFTTIKGFSNITGPATILLLSIQQTLSAVAAYRDIIAGANSDLSKQLDGMAESYRDSARSVTTVTAQSTLLAQVNGQISAAQRAINTAKEHGFTTDQKTLSELNDYLQKMIELRDGIEGLTPTMLDQRAATQSANEALDKQFDTVSKLADGFEKAGAKYKEYLANLQATEGKTVAERVAGTNYGNQTALDQLNQTSEPRTHFSTPEQVQAYVQPAAQAAREAANAQAEAIAAAAVDTATKEVNRITEEIAQTKIKPLVIPISGAMDQDQRGRALDAAQTQKDAEIAALQKQLNAATDAQGSAATNLTETKKGTFIDGKIYAQALQETIPALAKVGKDANAILKQQDVDDLKTQQDAIKAGEALNEQQYKDGLINVQQYLAKKQSLLDQGYALQNDAITGQPAQTQEHTADQLRQLDIQTDQAQQALNQETLDKTRDALLEQLTLREANLAVAQKLAKAAGDVPKADNLGFQITQLQAIAAAFNNAKSLTGLGPSVTGFNATHYAYPGDATPDSESAKGNGKFTAPGGLVDGFSVALSDDVAKNLGALPGALILLTNALGQTRVAKYDDRAPEDQRVDLYDPNGQKGKQPFDATSAQVINSTDPALANLGATLAAQNQLTAGTLAQTDAGKQLELQEKEAADALTELQTKKQAIQQAEINPDAKQDALRQNLLAQNVVLNQQIALLEKRLQLAQGDLTKSPVDRQLAAAGIQQQISQDQRQVQTNSIDAGKDNPDAEFTNELQAFINGFGTSANQAAKVVTGTLGTAVDSLASNLTKAITGAETLRSAIINFGEAATEQFIELALKMAIALAIQTALDVASGGAALGAGAATGGIGGFLGLLGFAEGGLVPGAPSHSDNRVATIATGEFVTRTAAVQHYGPGLFAALNSMAIPRDSLAHHDFPVAPRASLGFAMGGMVGPLPFAQSGGSAAQPSPTHVHVGLIKSQSEQEEWLRKGNGRKITVDIVNGLLREYGVTS